MRIATVTTFLSLLIGSSVFAQAVDTPAAAEPVADATAAAQTTPTPEHASDTPTGHEPQTVTAGLGNGPIRMSGWFLAPTFTTSSLDGSRAYSPGIRGGIFIARRVSLGITAHAVANGDSYVYGTPVRNVGTYGGLLIQYAVESNRLVHATLESTLGAGRWCVEISKDRDGCMGSNFLVFEPVANVELNVAKHVRVAAGVGYRFAVSGTGPGPNGDDVSSLVGRTSLIFGSF